MKKTFALLLAFMLTMPVIGQTLNVQVGSVTYHFPAAQTGEMTYTNGTSLTIMGKTFTLADIDVMTIDNTQVTANNVSVEYNGTAATVSVAGNVARYITPTVSGAHVSIVQTNTADVDGDEITYELSGNASDGEFALEGSYKCTVSLAGVTLTNPSGPVINIGNKKRIQISAQSGTVNTLTDGTEDIGSWKGCLYSKGQIQLQGRGSLIVCGRNKHAIKSGDYITMKNLTLDIQAAEGDGISCNKYFSMNSGTLTISGTADDAIQCDYEEDDEITGTTTDHENENSGNIYIEGGTLTMTTTGAGAKCLNADSTVYVNGGTLTLNASGSVDTSDSSDLSYVAGIKGGRFVQNGGDINITVKGTAGRGVNAYDIETNGGTLTITNSATPTTISNDVKSAKGMRGLNMALNGGTIRITMSGQASKAIRCGDGTKSSSGGQTPGGHGGWGGPSGGSSAWSNITGSYSQGLSDGSGPVLTVTQTGSSSSSSSAKAIKAICAITIYGGQTEVSTTTNGAEGLESKSGIDIRGGQHYLKCYDDCINSAGKITFNGGITVCYSTGNDAIDSNAGSHGAITIGDGVVLSYMTKGNPDEAFDCDNNNYIQITGTGIAIGAGGKQSSASGTISGARQGYAFPGTVSFKSNVYNTLADASGNNLVTFQLPVDIKSTCTFITATGMVSGSKYTVRSSGTAPTDATTVWHGLYLGSTAVGTTSVATFTAN